MAQTQNSSFKAVPFLVPLSTWKSFILSFCASTSQRSTHLLVLVLVLGFPAARHPRRRDIAGDDRDLVQWHVHPSGGKSRDAHTRTSCPAARAKGMVVPAEAPLPAGDTEISRWLRNKAGKLQCDRLERLIVMLTAYRSPLSEFGPTK